MLLMGKLNHKEIRPKTLTHKFGFAVTSSFNNSETFQESLVLAHRLNLAVEQSQDYSLFSFGILAEDAGAVAFLPLTDRGNS